MVFEIRQHRLSAGRGHALKWTGRPNRLAGATVSCCITDDFVVTDFAQSI